MAARKHYCPVDRAPEARMHVCVGRPCCCYCSSICLASRTEGVEDLARRFRFKFEGCSCAALTFCLQCLFSRHGCQISNAGCAHGLHGCPDDRERGHITQKGPFFLDFVLLVVREVTVAKKTPTPRIRTTNPPIMSCPRDWSGPT